MPAYKDNVKKTWYTAFYYTNWQGKRVKKLKRGFSTKKEALEWERLLKQTANLSMTFESFVKIYYRDMESRLKGILG